MTGPHRRRLLGGLAGVAVFAAGHGFVDRARPAIGAAGPMSTFAVTSAADAGPGTLREAILRAAGSPAPARIVLRVPRIPLRSPLPPIVNAEGLRVESTADSTLVDASRLAAVPVLDIRSPDTRLDGLRIRNARGVAILIRAPDVTLSGIQIDSSEVGVLTSSQGRGLRLQHSRLAANGIGVRLEASDARTSIVDNTFTGHETASIWAVSAPRGTSGPGFLIARNTFSGDRIALVMGNLASVVLDNLVIGSRDTGVYLVGAGVDVAENRIRRSGHTGIRVVGAEGSRVRRNEVADSRAIGILVSSSSNTLVDRNDVYRNGYGIVVVFGLTATPNVLLANSVFANENDGLSVIGGSPVLRENRLRGNRLAGLRILDVVRPGGASLAAAPLLRSNTLEGNGFTGPVAGVYRLEADR